MKVGKSVSRFYLLVCILLPPAFGFLTLFGASRTYSSFCVLHKSYSTRGNPIDCAQQCLMTRKTCIGIVKMSIKHCYVIATALSSTRPNETKSDVGLTKFYKIGNTPSICPTTNWTFTSPSSNLTSVYFTKDFERDCRGANGRMVVISSEGEMGYVTWIQRLLGIPLVLAAWSNGTRWFWREGQEKMTPEFWENSMYPISERGWVGAIVDDIEGMVSFDTNGTHYSVLCECYTMTEF